MSTLQDPEPFETLFASARRHELRTAPELETVLEKPRRLRRHVRTVGALGLASVVGAGVLAALLLPREGPLPPDPAPEESSFAIAVPTATEGVAVQPPVASQPAPPPPEELRALAGAPSVGEKALPARERDFEAHVSGVGNQDPLVGAFALKEIVTVTANTQVVHLDKSDAVSSSPLALAESSNEYIQDLPVPGRFYQNVLTLAPGVSDGSGGEVIRELPSQFNTERYQRVQENEFLAATENPLSTFSIDVDTASYAVVRRYLRAGKLPPSDAVRIEELLNYFPYAYPPPPGEAPFSVNVEIASCPWSPTHRLARIGLKGEEVKRQSRRGTNLVFLIDVSGSMQDPDKLPLLKSALKLLVEQLGAGDQVAMVVYAGASGLVLPATPGSQKSDILSALEMLSAGGSTNGGEGLRLAYQIAREHLVPGGINRVILATDGDFNVGVTDHGQLLRLVEEQARAGIALTTLGFGMGNYKDDTLELLANRGNGNHFYLDDEREARKVLVEQVGGTLVTIAKDVKIQVEFNPRVVGAYRLIGYENRLLRKEDFNDDRKDAGEIGSGHDVTALYELVPPSEVADLPAVDALKYQTPSTPAGGASKESFTVKLRYKEPDGEKSLLLSVPVTDGGAAIEAASADLRFAAAVAAFGMTLRDSAHKGSASLDMTTRLAQGALGPDPGGYRREFLELVTKAPAK